MNEFFNLAKDSCLFSHLSWKTNVSENLQTYPVEYDLFVFVITFTVFSYCRDLCPSECFLFLSNELYWPKIVVLFLIMIYLKLVICNYHHYNCYINFLDFLYEFWNLSYLYQLASNVKISTKLNEVANTRRYANLYKFKFIIEQATKNCLA